MKKILLLIIPILILTGCTNKEKEVIKIKKSQDINFSTYKDDNPITVGLYEDENLIKEYSTTLGTHKVITVFNIYYTNEEKLENNYIKYNWNKYYNNYESIEKYKIGFHVTFEADGQKFDKLILTPSDAESMIPYMVFYLYDDIQQEPGAWYSHLEEKDLTEETIYSSIKVCFSKDGDKVTSPITLTVFTYDEDDFDKNNNYRGNSSHTITINIQ